VAKINTGRVIQGGLLAGLVINIISILNNGMVLAPKYMADRQAGRFLLEPRFPFYPAWMIAMFLLGLELVWLYAAVRPRFGPGPRTALTVGIVVGVLSALPDNLANAAWGLSGRYLPFMWAVERVVACSLGALVGAWWYREEDGAV
jgi:uncharacterized membrane protein